MHDHDDLPASWAEHRGDIDAARSAGYFDDPTRHQLAGLVPVDTATVALCACGWQSGRRRTRTIALESLDAHIRDQALQLGGWMAFLVCGHLVSDATNRTRYGTGVDTLWCADCTGWRQYGRILGVAPASPDVLR